MGASPDSIVNCDCCGRRVLEATTEPTFFLQEVNGSFTLKRDHAYYYQIQLQMKLCGTNFGDFIVWRENELGPERIPIDEEFLTAALEKATKFFIYGILPEVLGKWYSSYANTSENSSGDIAELSQNTHSKQTAQREVWCFCRCEESGEMVACDNEQCKIRWFHIDGLRIEKVPRGKWFCPECTKGKRGRKRKVAT